MSEVLHIFKFKPSSADFNFSTGAICTASESRSGIVFWGEYSLCRCNETERTNEDLGTGSFLLYAAEEEGGFIEFVRSKSTTERAFFGIKPEVFDRILSVTLAHFSNDNFTMELQINTVEHSDIEETVKLAALHVNISESGERDYRLGP